MSTQKYILLNDKPITIDVKKGQIVKINKNKTSPEVKRIVNEEYQVKLNNRNFKGEVVKLAQNQCTVLINGNTYYFTIETEKSFKRLKKIQKKSSDRKESITAMLPGLICDILVEPGQEVQKGETLLTLEAMKMQNEIVCPKDGIVKKVFVTNGDNVIKGQALTEIEIHR
jgi:biotin carboxyl carrier protein